MKNGVSLPFNASDYMNIQILIEFIIYKRGYVVRKETPLAQLNIVNFPRKRIAV